MVAQAPIRERERTSWNFFLTLPDERQPELAGGLVKRVQLLQPLFEFSGALGANDTQTVQAFEEAEAFDGPALIIAFGPCVAHGYDLTHSLEQQKLAVQSGYWPLFRYNPVRASAGQSPLSLDSRAPSVPLTTYLLNETRFDHLTHDESARALLKHARAGRGRTLVSLHPTGVARRAHNGEPGTRAKSSDVVNPAPHIDSFYHRTSAIPRLDECRGLACFVARRLNGARRTREGAQRGRSNGNRACTQTER
jgi:hypothetical protein